MEGMCLLEENDTRAHSCPVCLDSMTQLHQARYLGRHDAWLDRCPTCQLIKVRNPHWYEEAYSDAICLADTGIVTRNLNIATALSALFRWMGLRGPFLDYGGGVGLLTRLMRDRGYDFRWFDEYADNALAPCHDRRVPATAG